MKDLETAIKMAFDRGIIERNDNGHVVVADLEAFINYLEDLIKELKNEYIH